jgi:hypothetical protein
MNYKQRLFSYGPRAFKPYKREAIFGKGTCGRGVKSNLDNHLLSLVSGVSNLSLKGKSKRTSGRGLKFIR